MIPLPIGDSLEKPLMRRRKEIIHGSVVDGDPARAHRG